MGQSTLAGDERPRSLFVLRAPFRNDELVIDRLTEGSKQKQYVAAHTAEYTPSPCVVNYDTVLSQPQALRQSDKPVYSSSALICSQARHGKSSGRPCVLISSFEKGKNYFLPIMGEPDKGLGRNVVQSENEEMVLWILNQWN